MNKEVHVLEVQWFKNGEVVSSSLRSLLRYLRGFETLAIHIRSGDGAMSNPSKYKERAMKTIWSLRKCSREYLG